MLSVESSKFGHALNTHNHTYTPAQRSTGLRKKKKNLPLARSGKAAISAVNDDAVLYTPHVVAAAKLPAMRPNYRVSRRRSSLCVFILAA